MTGATGQIIIRSIVGGERVPRKLAALRNYRCKKDEEEIAQMKSISVPGWVWLQNTRFQEARSSRTVCKKLATGLGRHSDEQLPQ